MTDLPKLAGTFKAARVEVCVPIKKWDELRKKLTDEDLDPRVVNARVGDVYFRVLVPMVRTERTAFLHIPKGFTDIISECGGELTETREEDLLCPFSGMEPCTVGAKTGVCAVCGVRFPLIGPIMDQTGNTKFFVISHHRGVVICRGTCIPPKDDSIVEA